jgi:aryl-alcohol dehydrogenase-like predicted oxidoreductase
MSTIALGRSQLHVSRVVLGCMFPARLGEAEITRVIHAACDAGISSFDTAPLYDFQRGEERLGRALRDRRQHVQLLTKAGLRWNDAARGRELFSFSDASGTRRVVRTDSRPDSLRAEVEGSCRRLGTPVLDLLQIHQPDVETDIADSIDALVALQRAGTIRAFGVSNYTPEQLQRAEAAASPMGLASSQTEYSLLQRSPERELLPLCARRDIGFLAYTPLAKGVLADRSSNRSAEAQRASRGSRFDDPLARVPLTRALHVLRAIAAAHDATTSQIALAWLLAQPAVSAVVVGASSVAQVRDVAGAAALSLRADETHELASVFARVLPWLSLADRVRATPVLGSAWARVSGASGR